MLRKLCESLHYVCVFTSKYCYTVGDPMKQCVCLYLYRLPLYVWLHHVQTLSTNQHTIYELNSLTKDIKPNMPISCWRWISIHEINMLSSLFVFCLVTCFFHVVFYLQIEKIYNSTVFAFVSRKLASSPMLSNRIWNKKIEGLSKSNTGTWEKNTNLAIKTQKTAFTVSNTPAIGLQMYSSSNKHTTNAIVKCA
jgi:hypothetical protein